MLILRLLFPVTTKVGAIGEIHFQPGYYVYCGSARRNLSSRLSRHMTRRKKLHWHIDYLTSRQDVCIETARVVSLNGMTECGLNSLVRKLPHAEAIPGFGCSDCTCASHLTFLGARPPDLPLGKSVFDARS